MPGIGSFLGGFAAGMQHAQDRKLKQEQLKLQQRHQDLQEKMGDINSQLLQQKLVHEQLMSGLGDEYNSAQGAENNLKGVQQDYLKSGPSRMGTSPEEFNQMNDQIASQPYSYAAGATMPGAAQPGPASAPTRSSQDVLRQMVVQNIQQHGLNAASAQALGVGGGNTVGEMTPEALALKMQAYQQALNPNGEGTYRPNINAKGQVSVATNPPPHAPVGVESSELAAYRKANPQMSEQQIRDSWQKIQEGYQTGRAKAGAVGRSQGQEISPAPLGKEKDMARINQKGDIELAPSNQTPEQLRQAGFRTVDPDLIKSAKALAPAHEALDMVNANSKKLVQESKGLLGTASNVAGALPGMAGSIAQRYGASNTADNLKAAGDLFLQHYESIFAGVRGASSPQIQDRLRERFPKAGMTPQQIETRTLYINKVFEAMENQLKSFINGAPIDQNAIKEFEGRLLMTDPNKPSSVDNVVADFTKRAASTDNNDPLGIRKK